MGLVSLQELDETASPAGRSSPWAEAGASRGRVPSRSAAGSQGRRQLYDVSSAGVNFADTHHYLS